MALKNPVMFVLLIIFAVVNIIDAITAYFILPGEANPVYLLTGSIIVVDIIKVAFVSLMIMYYKRNIYASDFSLFMLILILILGSLMTSFAVWGNIQGMMHPELVEYASTIPTAQKVQAYFSFVAIFYLLPFGVTLFSFKLYEWSKKKAKIDKAYYKKMRWWKV